MPKGPTTAAIGQANLRAVVAVLLANRGPDGWARVTRDMLAAGAKVSPRTVGAHLRSLEARGCISLETTRGTGTWVRPDRAALAAAGLLPEGDRTPRPDAAPTSAGIASAPVPDRPVTRPQMLAATRRVHALGYADEAGAGPLPVLVACGRAGWLTRMPGGVLVATEAGRAAVSAGPSPVGGSRPE